MNYNAVIQEKVRSMTAADARGATYAFHDPTLETTCAFRADHSTRTRPTVPVFLGANFPLFSSLQSGGVRAAQAAVAAPLLSRATIDYGMHALETLVVTESASALSPFPFSSSSAERGAGGVGGAAPHCVWLFGEWTRAEAALRAGGVITGADSVRLVGAPPHALGNESEWIATLHRWRAEVPLTHRVAVFFDMPVAATSDVDRDAFLKLQLVMLYVLHPDVALLRFWLPRERAANRQYARGRLVLPMVDGPTVEQLLLLTTAPEYDAALDTYPAAKIRDQFQFFARETVPKTDFRDLSSGVRTSYLVRRQQAVMMGGLGAPPYPLTTGAEEGGGEGGDGTNVQALLPLPVLPLSALEFGGTDGFVSVVARDAIEGEDDEQGGMESRVRMLHMHTFEQVVPRAPV